VYVLIILWVALAGIFLIWGINSFIVLIDIPTWSDEFVFTPLEQEIFNTIIPVLHIGYLTSTIIAFVFAFVYVIVAYGIFKKDTWVWSAGLIFSTIFLAIFGLLLSSFMINTIIFRDEFSIIGLMIVIIAFITNLGIVFFHTRPNTKIYFGVLEKKK
jgi:hypothetical protein